MKASEFDQKFDDGEDIFDYLDLTNARRPAMLDNLEEAEEGFTAELQKARFAADVFSERKYKNCFTWLVEEHTVAYTNYRDSSSEIDKRTYYGVVSDRYLYRMDTETAYLIAMVLMAVDVE